MSDETAQVEAPSETVTEQAAAPAVAESPKAAATLARLLEAEASVQAQREALKAEAQEVERYKAIAAMSPVDKAKALGLSLADFQKSTIDDYDPTGGLKNTVSELQKKLEERDRREAEAERAATMQEAQEAVRTYIDSSGKFPVIAATGFHSAVFDRIEMARKAGKTISEEQAASEVEESLTNLVTQAQALEKFKAKKPESKPEPENMFATLTNSTSSEIANPAAVATFDTEEDRLDAFVAHLRSSKD